MQKWITGTVISKLPDGQIATLGIGLTHHQSMIFIMVPNEPCEKENNSSLDDVPTVDMVLQSYVNISVLSEGLQKQIRKELKKGMNK